MEAPQKEDITKSNAFVHVINMLTCGRIRRTSHLSLNGVEETPPTTPAAKGEEVLNHKNLLPTSKDRYQQLSETSQPYRDFVDLSGNNVGFKHWHPTPVTGDNLNLPGHGGLGGAWEWTSTVLEKHQAFKPMDMYPGYTGELPYRTSRRCLLGREISESAETGRPVDVESPQ